MSITRSRSYMTYTMGPASSHLLAFEVRDDDIPLTRLTRAATTRRRSQSGRVDRAQRRHSARCDATRVCRRQRSERADEVLVRAPSLTRRTRDVTEWRGGGAANTALLPRAASPPTHHVAALRGHRCSSQKREAPPLVPTARGVVDDDEAAPPPPPPPPQSSTSGTAPGSWPVCAKTSASCSCAGVSLTSIW